MRVSIKSLCVSRNWVSRIFFGRRILRVISTELWKCHSTCSNHKIIDCRMMTSSTLDDDILRWCIPGWRHPEIRCWLLEINPDKILKNARYQNSLSLEDIILLLGWRHQEISSGWRHLTFLMLSSYSKLSQDLKKLDSTSRAP